MFTSLEAKGGRIGKRKGASEKNKELWERRLLSH
jgi:hypothetical protein